ncbi:Retrovirus-related Pol polyprotein from transposon TNT 1-94 [Vitis vinifera]|uniref:Retrovirus-related Pol polyprotein from transposon TNT 1-94 n=1 Tax=Vitis vinifera TaxID=29760 RepID=A0A438GV23_VITVI|nr:Retrovirus-related Pol polyprotein from transposon TNT 1-94 [Vitis vinifera]
MLSTHFDMKDLGEASYVLSIKILRDRANGVLKLSQRAYIERILKRFNMHNCKSTKALIVKGDKFSKAQCPQNDDEREEMKTIPYSSVVGSLMYAQVCTRPDIAFVVGMLGRYLSNPRSQHWKAAKKVLRYLQGTKDLMLTYQRTSLLDVVGFCDADFASCIDDKKSTTGYIFMMARGAVSWKSVKQTLTASSTMEAKYVACYEACCHAMWMRNFISALGVVDSISRPLKLFCDNSAAVAFSKNTRSISRFKHIDVKFYFVKEKVVKSLIDIEHMSTKKGKSSLTRNSRTIKHRRSFLNTRKEQEMAFHGINQATATDSSPINHFPVKWMQIYWDLVDLSSSELIEMGNPDRSSSALPSIPERVNHADASTVLVLPKMPSNILIGFKQNLGPNSTRSGRMGSSIGVLGDDSDNPTLAIRRQLKLSWSMNLTNQIH